LRLKPPKTITLLVERSILKANQPKPPCSLDLTGFKLTSPCPPLGTEFVAFSEDYQKTGNNFLESYQDATRSRRISEWLDAQQTWPSASNPHPSISLQAPSGARPRFWGTRKFSYTAPASSLPELVQLEKIKRIDNSVQRKLA
jgi:hypothetical protein